ncbi:MAG: ABC transporter permease [Promethearchaeota archaeon]
MVNLILGALLILNYIVGFITSFAESFFFCTIGIIIAALGIYILIPQIKKIQYPYFGAILTILGAIELILGFKTIMEELTVLNIIQVGETILGGMFFIIGMVLLGCLMLPLIITGLSYILKPILQFMRSIMARNVLRNARRTQNTFAMISIGVAFSTLTGSLGAGVYPGAKLTLGGDMRVGWTSGYIPINFTTTLKNLQHVTSMAPMWGISSGCIIDFPTEEFRIRYYVINTTEYAKLHKEPTLMELISPSKLSVYDFIHRLDQENSTIIFHELGDKLNYSIGDFINATSFIFNSIYLQIVGLCGKMPGMPYTYRDYSFPYYVVIISWNTLFAITGYNSTTFPYNVYYNVGLDTLSNDIVVKNQITEIIEKYRPVSEYEIRSVRSQVEEYGGIINTVNVILNQVLFIALLVSLLGLSITMNISVRQRRAEIGILRAIGISKKQILKVIFGETLTISLAGILFGSLTGITTGFLMIKYFPFIEWLAVIFTVSWVTLAIYWSILLSVALISSVIPAYNVSKMKIVESIRMRGK